MNVGRTAHVVMNVNFYGGGAVRRGMADTPVGLVLPQTAAMPRVPAVDDVGEFGRTIEALGYESVWMNESWGSDAFLELAAVARATDELRLGTSIVNVYTRTPATLAMAAATLARLSDDRFVLGLGAGHPGLVEDLHNVPWERPIKRMAETIPLVKRMLGAGPELAFESDLFDVSGFESLDANVPIYSAALGPANRRVTGRVSDGWIPYQVPFDRLEASFETIADAAREANRDPADIAVVPYVAAVVSDDRSVARDALRANIAGYVGGFSDDSYKNAVGEGFAEEADRIADAWRRGDERAAERCVTDEMLDALGIAGTAVEARDKLRSLRERPFVDRVLVAIPHAVDRETAHRTYHVLAPGND